MRMTNTEIVTKVRQMSTSRLIELTAELRATGALHLLERPLQALEHEQDRRCVADPGTAQVLADRMGPTDNITTDATFVTTTVHTMTTAYLNDLITDGFRYVNSESILDELQERALKENVARGLDDEVLSAMIEMVRLSDSTAGSESILLGEQERRRAATTQRSSKSGAPHGKGCSCCSAGVAQWR